MPVHKFGNDLYCTYAVVEIGGELYRSYGIYQSEDRFYHHRVGSLEKDELDYVSRYAKEKYVVAEEGGSWYLPIVPSLPYSEPWNSLFYEFGNILYANRTYALLRYRFDFEERYTCEVYSDHNPIYFCHIYKDRVPEKSFRNSDVGEVIQWIRKQVASLLFEGEEKWKILEEELSL